MDLQLNVDFLNKNELSYECTIRGVALGTVDAMRKSLKIALALEVKSSLLTTRPVYPFTFDIDSAACTELLGGISTGISEITADNVKARSKKWSSILHHVISRIKNSIPTSANEEAEKSNLLYSVQKR